MPATAHISSLSDTSPETPQAPTIFDAAVANEHAARIGDHAAAARRRQHGEELRGFRRAASQRARAEAHAERAPGFAEGDVETQDAGFILALERDQVAAGIEHGDGERREIGLARLFQRDIDDGGSLRKGH